MEDSKEQKSTKRLPPNAGKGRAKGTPNKMTKEVKQMVMEALEGVGGVEYLMKQAEDKPVAFLALVGKLLPLQLTGAGGGPIEISEVRLVPMKSA